MTMHYSPSTGGFYDSDLHGEGMPGDAVYVTPSRHAELMQAQIDGAAIAASAETGNPVILSAPKPDLAERQARALARIERETSHRIGGVGALLADINRLKRIVVDGAAPNADDQARFSQLEDLQNAATAIEADMRQHDEPEHFDPRLSTRWP